MRHVLLVTAIFSVIFVTADQSQAQRTNVALGKKTSQSSEFSPASLAVDGKTDGDYFHGSVTHTDNRGTTDPWWQVDLGADYLVSGIEIWNRTDCCAERLDKVRIFIRSSETAPWEWFSPEGRLFSSNGENPMYFKGNSQGRYVRIQIVGAKVILSLAEVLVYGSDLPKAPPVLPLINASVNEGSLGTNVAIGKTASQSSNADPVNGQASKAIDGNTDGIWSNGSVTHTLAGGSNWPWWQVDLGGAYNITAIQLFNRTDCCSERLNQVQILVGSDLKEMGIFSSGSNGYYYNRQNPVTYRDNKTGRFVRVLLQGDKAILSLAEVKVFGTPMIEPVAVVVPEPQPEPTVAPEPQPEPQPGPTPCIPPGGRAGYVWDQASCSWVSTIRPQPVPTPFPTPVPPAPGTAKVNLARVLNVALQQSTTAAGGDAIRAVDGNTDGNFAANSVTHTADQTRPWWQIDLGALYWIDEIKIYNRTDCCQERLRNIQVDVSWDPINPGTNWGMTYGKGSFSGSNPMIFRKDIGYATRYIRITVEGKGILSLAEVEIIGLNKRYLCDTAGDVLSCYPARN